jgi:hypothetical protein
MVQNPLRLLKRGFATYPDQDRAPLANVGKQVKEDVERDRSLLPGEEDAILNMMHDRAHTAGGG